MDSTPDLVSLSPMEGTNGTLLSLFGHRLSLDPTQSTVSVGEQTCSQVVLEAAGSAQPGEVKLSCRVAPNVAGTHAVEVRTRFGIAFSALSFTYGLELRGVTPSSGSLAGGTVLTLGGDGFPAAASAKFADVTVGGVPCDVVSSSHSELTCTTRASTAGSVAVTATVRGVQAIDVCPLTGCNFEYSSGSTPALSS
eukprot:186369-Prymnesium_polylepis.1